MDSLLSKSKKFSGGDVVRAQGDGFLFDAVWSFQVATDSQKAGAMRVKGRNRPANKARSSS